MNNKYCGKSSDFSYIRDERTRIVVCYDLKPANNGLYEWYEIFFYKKKINSFTFEDVMDAIIADINANTDAKILNGYQWQILHGENAGKVVTVWLSNENQSNFKAKHDSAIQYPDLVEFPMQFKVSEVEDKETRIKTPIYEYFQNVNELSQFYLGGLAYIERTLAEGWARKDAIDWSNYSVFFPVTE